MSTQRRPINYSKEKADWIAKLREKRYHKNEIEGKKRRNNKKELAASRREEVNKKKEKAKAGKKDSPQK